MLSSAVASLLSSDAEFCGVKLSPLKAGRGFSADSKKEVCGVQAHESA